MAPVNRSEENYTKGDLFPAIVAQGGEEKQGKMSKTQEAIAAIEAQQPKEHSAVWAAGEQLKDMIRGNESAAEILLTDLRENKEMTLAAAEKKIAERAKKNKVGNCGCVTPAEAEDILREFFGLPGREKENPRRKEERKVVDLADFL